MGRFAWEYARDHRIRAFVRDADLMQGRCQCDCGPYLPGPLFAALNWRSEPSEARRGCRGDVRCELSGQRRTEEVWCAPAGFTPTTPRPLTNLSLAPVPTTTATWQPPSPTLSCALVASSAPSGINALGRSGLRLGLAIGLGALAPLFSPRICS